MLLAPMHRTQSRGMWQKMFRGILARIFRDFFSTIFELHRRRIPDWNFTLSAGGRQITSPYPTIQPSSIADLPIATTRPRWLV